MNLCSERHPEVCYESRICPVCDLRADMEEEINHLRVSIENLKEQIESLKED